MAKSADADQTAPSGVVWSGSALFACAILLASVVYEILGHLLYMKFAHCMAPDKGFFFSTQRIFSLFIH